LGGSVGTIKKNTEALVVASTIRLEVNADKTKCMVMSRDQNAGRIQNIKNDNNSFDNVEQLICLRTPRRNQNSIQK